MLFCSVLPRTAVLCCAVLCCAVLCCAVLCCAHVDGATPSDKPSPPFDGVLRRRSRLS
ncbi:hypothetical protein LX32DRAFT_646896 [Colletotrichum zoysiae]|uniref:Uncharacterized protein n=1 Tax=Colletotrichum zoysiae TaxID=1216348 RepID=A0AAD9H329_9PEZI|nr:hypothetical protein LX32DRAFT_646896 [Colletotrichum zoysiae]